MTTARVSFVGKSEEGAIIDLSWSPFGGGNDLNLPKTHQSRQFVLSLS
jgi:hypothetical protein